MLSGNGILPVMEVNAGNRNDGMFGGDGLLGIILIIALLGGGFGGFGGFGNRGGAVAEVDNTVWNAQQFSTLDTGIRSLQSGLSSVAFDLNNSIKDGFNAVGNGICNAVFQINNSIRDISAQMCSCCNELSRNIDNVRYEGAKNTCDIITAVNASSQRVLDFLCANQSQALRDENLFLKLRNAGCVC